MSRFTTAVSGKRTLCGALLCCLLTTACTLAEVRTPEVPPLHGYPDYTLERTDPLALSPEMKQFVETQLSGLGDGESPAWKLAYAMLNPWLLDFAYDPRVTLTAEEAFRQRQGNCLTFSNMFVAMAREAGMEAWYREVEIAPEWSNVDDTLLVSMHVNAEVRDHRQGFIIDVSRRKPRDGERYRRLSDAEAEAQFYNNLGAEALVANDLGRAHAYFEMGAAIDPSLAYLWSNLGVVLRRNGQTEDAMLAYRTALELDPWQSVAVNNLYAIYEQDGHSEEAQRLEARVERNRRKNPYYLDSVAKAALEEDDWKEAEALARRAIRIERNEYRFYYTLARAQFLSGELNIAQISLDKARRLAPPDVSDEDLTLPGGG